MIRKKEFRLQVNNGPSEMDLLASFITAYAKAPNQPFKVTFEIESEQGLPQGDISTPSYKYQAVITKISREEWDENRFTISGILYDDHNGQLKMEIHRCFDGYFHTGSRKGCLTFTCEYGDDR